MGVCMSFCFGSRLKQQINPQDLDGLNARTLIWTSEMPHPRESILDLVFDEEISDAVELTDISSLADTAEYQGENTPPTSPTTTGIPREASATPSLETTIRSQFLIATEHYGENGNLPGSSEALQNSSLRRSEEYEQHLAIYMENRNRRIDSTPTPADTSTSLHISPFYGDFSIFNSSLPQLWRVRRGQPLTTIVPPQQRPQSRQYILEELQSHISEDTNDESVESVVTRRVIPRIARINREGSSFQSALHSLSPYTPYPWRPSSPGDDGIERLILWLNVMREQGYRDVDIEAWLLYTTFAKVGSWL